MVCEGAGPAKGGEVKSAVVGGGRLAEDEEFYEKEDQQGN
jgi:hypothetical protein